MAMRIQLVSKPVPTRCKAWMKSLQRLTFLLALIPRLALGGNFYTNTSPSNVPWTNGIVPYEFTNSLSLAESNTYMAGLREWQLAANVTFVPHTNQTHWVLFTYNTNWIDNVSASTNPQVVTVSSLSRAQVCHEMGHSFGFTHENIRADATNFIAVLTNNIYGESSNLVFFTIDPGSVTNGPYDYESVMHLGWDFESTNPGVLATQQPKPPNFPRYQFRMGNYCLSPGDRAALAYLYGPPAVPLTNVVTTTADVGPGSLRAAIYYATDHPGSTVRFNIPTSDPGYSNGVYNIHLTGMLPPLVANGTVIDGSTQPGFTSKPVIFVDASQIIPETFTSDTVLIYSSSNQVNDIAFTGFDWNGVTLLYPDATNNTITGCWLGVDATGTNAAPNAFQGILVGSGASRNTFGPTNVISGNTQYGIFIADSNTTGNVVLGNYIGTTASGSNALANGSSGVFIGNGSTGNTIGGTNTAARNILSGNSQYGVLITDTNTTGNIVLGNFIGTDVHGSNAVPNGYSGVLIGGGAGTNVIGSTNAAGRNLISGNTQYGIYLSNTVANVILGNYFGVDASGNTALANVKSGVGLFGGTQNVIGGTVAGAGNVFSGNLEYGVDIRGPAATGNFIEGNIIGLGAAGTNAIPGSSIGVGLQAGAISNIIGGAVAGARNVISGNSQYGIFISDIGTSNNVVAGNLIGTGIAGTNAMGNVDFGIGIWNGASGNVIGGNSAGARNVISGTTGYGYGITLGGANGNVIQGNYIGTDINGKSALPNNFAGVALYSSPANNIIGGGAGAGNVISGNYSYGIYMTDPGTTGNWIQGNIIGADATGTNALPNNYAGLIIFAGITNNIIGLKPDNSGNGNEIAFNGGDGVQVGDSYSMTIGTGIAIRGNSIFSNGYLGIELVYGSNNNQTNAVVTNAFGYVTSTIVLGKLTSLASKPYTIDLYRNLANVSGEGQFYLGKVSVTTDGSGNANFAYTNSAANYAGQYITATATSANGDTSEFSLAVLATNQPASSAQFSGNYSWKTNTFTASLTLQTNFSYRIQTTTNLGPSPVVWIDLTNFTATNTLFNFSDKNATNKVRFYRVVSP
jgi:hypothetical protein